MSLITRCQKETLVYWAQIGTKVTGEPIWGPPEQLTCRWDHCAREIIQPNNTKIFSKIELITEKLLEIGGLVRRGTLVDTAYWEDPKANEDVYEILQVDETPTLNYSERLYEAYA